MTVPFPPADEPLFALAQVGVDAAPAQTSQRRRGSVLGMAGATYIVTALSIVTGPLAARAVGPAGRGQLATATVWCALLTQGLAFGMPPAVGYAIGRRHDPPRAVLGAILKYTLFTLPVSVAVGATVVATSFRGFGPSARVVAAALIVLSPIGVFTACALGFLVAEGALGPLTRIQAAPALFTAAVTIVLFSVGKLSVAAYLAGFLAAIILAAAMTWRAIGVTPTRGAPLRPLLGFGLRAYGGSLALFGATRVDQAVIGPVLGSTKLGIYAVAVAVSLLPFAFGPALASRAFSEVAAASDDRERFTVISHWLRMTLLVGGAATAAVALAGPVLVPVVYGNAFRDARLPLLLLLPGTIVLILNATASTCLVALGRPGQATWSEFSGFAVTAVGLVVVVRPFGIVGAAILSTVTYATSFAAFRTFLRRAGPVSFVPRKAELVEAVAMARAVTRRAISAMTPSRKAEPAGDDIGPTDDGDGPAL